MEISLSDCSIGKFYVMTVLLEYLNLFITNVISCSMFNKANAVHFILDNAQCNIKSVVLLAWYLQ